MENWFSDNALAKLLQTAPELAPYIVTFNDLSDQLPEETGVKAGVFVLQAGTEFFFVPVIAKSDTLFPIDSIFSDAKKKFFPLTKNAVQELLSVAASSLGVKAKAPASMPKNPDLSTFVNPPRTGKFTYASSNGRLIDFLAAIPNHMKRSVMDKLLADREVYNGLNKMFGLSEVLTALKPSVEEVAKEKPVITIVTDGPNLSPTEITEILNEGFAVRGKLPFERVAIPKQSYENLKVSVVGHEDQAYEVDVAMDDGIVRTAFVPRLSPANTGNQDRVFALFADGSYIRACQAVSVGERKPEASVLQSLFAWRPPKLLKDVAAGEKFALFDSDKSLIGVFECNNITRSSIGESLNVRDVLTGSDVTLRSSRNLPAPLLSSPKEIWVKSYSFVVDLDKDRSHKLSRSPVEVSSRWNMRDLEFLGDKLDLSFDGVEFAVGGRSVGDKVSLAKRLIVSEGIAPDLARNFIKQAQESKHLTLFMSKKASDNNDALLGNAQVPSQQEFTGPTPGANINGLPGQVAMAMQTQDQQAVEATIISELLQAPDMAGLMIDYMPDIEECIDRLGRTLLLCRVHSAKLNESMDGESLTSLMTTIKGVYRNLGDAAIKLQRIIATGIQ